MNIIIKHILTSSLFITAGTILSPVMSETQKHSSLPINQFIQLATQNDVKFESILIDQLAIKYRRDVLLPDSDIIMDVKYQHHFYLNQNSNEPEAIVSLSKLFPYNGTQLSLSYSKTASALTTSDTSSLQFLITQPIAQNAFGKGTVLQDKIIGIENDIRRYQIIEAYEDYLASLTTAYYNWYSAYENLKVGKSSYQSNQKLMANILERQKQKIALPIDVNKMRLLLISKKENIIVLQEIYDAYSNLIFKAIRHKATTPYIPIAPERPTSTVQFETDYAIFTQSSRTYQVLNLLEQQGTMQVKKSADDLLPSTNLLLGYQLEGKEWGIQDQQRSYFAGISLHWPIGRSVDKAKQSIAKIEYKKTILSNQNKYEELHTNLNNLYLQIQREEKLISIANKKIILSIAILKDEAENYSFGKVTLNDYIAAVNRADENRFSYTEHSVKLNKLLVEWLRLTDQLVNKSVLDN
ncbi:MAG: TolC family protein [Woeseiaceae bacterium]